MMTKLNPSTVSSADLVAILQRAEEAESLIIKVGCEYLSRLDDENAERIGDGIWEFVGFEDSQDALVPGMNFCLKYIPSWGEDESDNAYYRIPFCVFDGFEKGVALALKERDRIERERAEQIDAAAREKERAERALYERLKAKFEPETVGTKMGA